MATYTKFNTFVADIANKVHNLGSDQLKVALTNTLPVNTNTILANITEISYTNISTRNITLTSSVQTSGTYKLIIADLVLTASGSVGPFRYAVIYNSTASGGPLIAWYDYGSSISLANGDTFTLDFDNVNGLLQIA